MVSSCYNQNLGGLLFSKSCFCCKVISFLWIDPVNFAPVTTPPDWPSNKSKMTLALQASTEIYRNTMAELPIFTPNQLDVVCHCKQGCCMH